MKFPNFTYCHTAGRLISLFDINWPLVQGSFLMLHFLWWNFESTTHTSSIQKVSFVLLWSVDQQLVVWIFWCCTYLKFWIACTSHIINIGGNVVQCLLLIDKFEMLCFSPFVFSGEILNQHLTSSIQQVSFVLK